MHILGLSSFKHNTAAALLVDGVIKAAIEEDKLTRSRSAGLPENAIRFCLESVGASWRDVDAIAVATRPFSGWRSRSLLPARLAALSPTTSVLHQANEVGVLARELREVRTLRSSLDGMGSNVTPFEHHLCHAASVFYLSPFDRALILTMDEEGDGTSGMIAVGEGARIRVLHKIPFPHSLGWLYSQITELLGFVPHHDEHKTQWLSLEGEPIFKNVFLEMLMSPSNCLPHLNRRYVNLANGMRLSSKFYRRVGLQEGTREVSDDLRRGLASSLQNACSEIVGSIIEDIRKREGIQTACLAGGLFQNALLVADLERRLGINAVFVPPAPGNSGCALGAGMLVWHQVMQKPRLPGVRCLYGGPPCNRPEIKEVLDNCKARYSYQNTAERKLDATVQLLQSGKIVGWFQGAAEFGPRALGNRSLLASPWASYVRENLNDYIKHREWFRPFAVAVTEEDCERYFECSELCQSMNSLASIRPSANVLPDGFVLPGNLVRLQVVQQQSNPLFWRLLKRFGEIAPAPVLVNTSFNLFGEPLVVKPRDAVRSYFCSGIDALIIDNFVLSKTPAKSLRAPMDLYKAASSA
jgi:carbamoyltransferase